MIHIYGVTGALIAESDAAGNTFFVQHQGHMVEQAYTASGAIRYTIDQARQITYYGYHNGPGLFAQHQAHAAEQGEMPHEMTSYNENGQAIQPIPRS